MQRLGAGEPDALGVLFRRHHERVHALCVRLTGDSASADDLVQETFVRVFRFARSFERRARFTTWLYRIVRNVCNDHNMRERRRKALSGQVLDGASSSSDSRLDVLELALIRLPEAMREAIVLSRFHDLPYAELAVVLGCSGGAARVRVHRALLELKRIVQEIEANDESVSTHS